MAQVTYMDNLLQEYLIYRGLSNTLKTLDTELRVEKDYKFNADKIVEQFSQSVIASDLKALRDLWQHLDTNLFTKLEHNYAIAVKKLENSLYKYYLVSAYNVNRMDKVNEFFQTLSAELQQQSEWKDWFYFPFCKNASESPTFSLYFSKAWQDTLLLSLRNFLSTVYQCIPQPTFVRAEHEALHMKRILDENKLLRGRLQQIQEQQEPACSAQNLSASSTSDSGGARRRGIHKSQLSLDDIVPFDISPPAHTIDDFCIIAAEVNNVSQASETQTRGLKQLIRNIGTGGSPVMGRKETSDRMSKRRSGSVGRNWQ